MSPLLMDPGIAAALAAGRTVIVPSVQRAAALRWNWARVKLAEGHTVWHTPEIITWEAWLCAQWQKAQLEGRVAAKLQRLNRSQQLKLWQQSLRSLAAEYEQADELALHSQALLSSAAQAVQWLLPLSRLAVTDEERLLASALTATREWCRQHDYVVLELCTPLQLAEFVSGPPPLIVGQRQLSALQQELGELCWPGTTLLHAVGNGADAPIRLRVARDLEEEVRACARWCREQLTQDPKRRLLVMSATVNASPEAQAVLLARELCALTNEVPEDTLSKGLLAVEGGAVLAHQQLIADALCALRLLRESVTFDDLSRVLKSAYFGWGGAAQWRTLHNRLAECGFAKWPADALRGTLQRFGTEEPGAVLLRDWLDAGRVWQGKASCSEWARRFSQWFGVAQFARGVDLESRDAQRLQRWNELLDEFAALDAMGETHSFSSALQELLQLALHARHAAQSGDAAITLTSLCGAPLARYDGIWVLGLAEQRWPEPPRPDPYVPLAEQRRCGWEASGARQRLLQAQWSLQQWRTATSELVLSYPRLEGDVHHRPSSVPGLATPHAWEAVDLGEALVEPVSITPAAEDKRLASLAVTPNGSLRNGTRRLELQQRCAFRGQAEIRLGARPAPMLSDGISPLVRGQLLHGVLEGLWQELQEQRALRALDAGARRALIIRHWERQLTRLAVEGRPPYPARLLERERLRTVYLILRILEIEDERPGFRVRYEERQLQLATPAGVMTLRVDRLDEDEQGHHWLIDYKSGKPEVTRLDRGEAQPLQLALYEQALAAQGIDVRGMALLSLSPVHAGYSGAAPDKPWSGSWRLVPDWPLQRQRWRQEVATLLGDHVGGIADVAPLKDACRHCHLAALCRRTDPQEMTHD